MPRSKNGTRRRERRHKIMKLAKGYWGGRSRLFKTAKEAVMKGLASSYRDRRRKKGEFRSLWIARISAAVRAEGMTYSQFMHGLARRRSSSTARRFPTWPSRIRWPSRPSSQVQGSPARRLPRREMITLEQIRLLESKITRALELIRVLKEENSTLRKGLESAQKRMRELETLVDGFKTDQKEIESVIVRTLHNLDELEESAAAGGAPAHLPPRAASRPHRRRSCSGRVHRPARGAHRPPPTPAPAEARPAPRAARARPRRVTPADPRPRTDGSPRRRKSWTSSREHMEKRQLRIDVLGTSFVIQSDESPEHLAACRPSSRPGSKR